MVKPGRHTGQLDSHVDAYRLSVGQFITRLMGLAKTTPVAPQHAVFEPGERVRLIASELNSADHAAKVWSVVECCCDLCALGSVVAVDEAVPGIGWRHFGAKALRHSGQPDGDELCGRKV
jgi:hypothetical protein